MHALSLQGVYSLLIAHSFRAMSEADVLRVGDVTRQVRRAVSVPRLQTELLLWYGREARTRDLASLYKLQDLSASMLGPAYDPLMATQAAEAGTLLDVAVDRARHYRGVLGQV